MYPYRNEDVAFERLKDLQREMENSRLVGDSLAGFGRVVRNLPVRARRIAGVAIRRVPRARPASPSG
ncbi:MAG: hypothetical protein ACREOY_06210 [Candidatus Dormibacteraceae bacterium]